MEIKLNLIKFRALESILETLVFFQSPEEGFLIYWIDECYKEEDILLKEIYNVKLQTEDLFFLKLKYSSSLGFESTEKELREDFISSERNEMPQ